MSTSLKWPNVKEVKKPIEYEMYSEDLGWHPTQRTKANQFANVSTALFGGHGAKAYFKGGANFKERYENRGRPYCMLIWKSGEGWAMLVNREYVALFPKDKVRTIQGYVQQSEDKDAAVSEFIDQVPAHLRRRLVKAEFE